jgi:hypothetical protein
VRTMALMFGTCILVALPVARRRTVYGRNRKRDEVAGFAGRRLPSNSGRCGLDYRWSASSERSHGRGGPKYGGVICRG